MRGLLIHMFLAWVVCQPVVAQRFVLESGTITFFSDAAIEDITATNSKVSSLLDVAGLSIAFSIPINEFEFQKSLMKEHFNEKYLESEKYPRSTFQGKLTAFKLEAGMQNATASGKLTIHGISRQVDIPGTIELQGGKLFLKTKFIVSLADYKIKIPQLLWQNIAEQVEVTAELMYKPQ